MPAGEVTALLGPNGAGKSSLVLAVGGVLRPRPGSVSLDGIELAGRRPEKIRAAGVAIVPEGRRLLPDLSVDDNLKVATYALSKQAAAEGRARALELFPRLGERLNVPARLLSGGEQQMVVLAQALVSQPKYILIDELSLGLAPVIVNQLIPVIRAGRGQRRRRAAHRAVRHRGAVARHRRARHGGRRAALLGHGRRAEGTGPSCCTPPTCCAAPRSRRPRSSTGRGGSRLSGSRPARIAAQRARPGTGRATGAATIASPMGELSGPGRIDPR